jgi:inhibitor of cysteine peptidase
MFSRNLFRLVGGAVILMTLVVGCGTSGPGEKPGETPDGGLVYAEATVNEVNLQIMESFPVQVAAVAEGNLKDSCTMIHEIRQSFDEETKTFTIEIATVRDADAVCAQVLEPFEERIDLDVRGLPAGTYTVDVNGVRETFTLDVDNEIPEDANTEIPWAEAQELIRSGRVVQVTQLHSLEVTLDLEDGTRLVTNEPEIDAVFDVVDECGDPCADIILATE